MVGFFPTLLAFQKPFETELYRKQNHNIGEKEVWSEELYIVDYIA